MISRHAFGGAALRNNRKNGDSLSGRESPNARGCLEVITSLISTTSEIGAFEVDETKGMT